MTSPRVGGGEHGHGLIEPQERERFGEEFIREVERRAGASREEMLKHIMRKVGPRPQQNAAVVWLRRILGRMD